MQYTFSLGLIILLVVGLFKYRSYAAKQNQTAISKTSTMRSAFRAMDSWDKNKTSDTRTVRCMKATLTAPSYYDQA